jgi:hypothetical protein
MSKLFLLIAFWPMLCCDRCDVTPFCVTASVSAAVVLYVCTSLIVELRALAALGSSSRHSPKSSLRFL